jgi:cysteine desulfurase
VVFTSGGSEADNMAIRGTSMARGGTAVCAAGEHHAVLEPVEHAGGVAVALTSRGTIDLDQLSATLQRLDDVCVVSAMLVNNETGAICDLDAVADVVNEHAPDAWLHTDAVQAAAWLDLSVVAARADMFSVTGHKLGGPVGTGAFIQRDGIAPAPLIDGGGQERGRRAGTPDVAGAVAFAAAMQLAHDERDAKNARLSGLRDELVAGLRARLGDRITPTLLRRGRDEQVVPGIAHVIFANIEAEALLFILDREGIAASAASSCSSGAQDPSHVLAAMGIDREVAQGSLRLSLGHATTAEEISRATGIISDAVEHLAAHGGG